MSTSTTPSPSTSSSATSTGANSDVAAENISEVVTTLVLNAVIGVIIMVLFEVKRKKRSVYAPRLEHMPHRTPPELPYGPLRWIWPVARMSRPETLRCAGMDAFCLIRFNYLCLRICLFATFWGMLVLTPLYSMGTAEADRIYVITLANVEQGSNTLWAALVFAYLFTWHALYVLKGEHKVFAEMREQYLTTGDPDFASQTRYTSKVEMVPAELRSSVALEAYFDGLFPGQVHSAVMCLKMPWLEAKVEKREKLADKLEKVRSIELATGRVIRHRERRFPCDCWGTQSGVTQAEYLASELRALNDEIKREQKAFLHSAQKLNAMDDKLMHTYDVAETGREGDAADEVAGDEEGAVENTGFVVLENRPREKLDMFLLKKADATSTWALEEEDVVEDSASSGSAPGGAEGEQNTHDEPGSIDDSTRTDGIDEEIQARRRSGSSSGGPTPGAKTGDIPAIETDQGTGTVGGFIEAAPDLAKGALSGLAFVGQTALDATRRVARGVLYLTLGQRMSATGFVTFRQMSTCAASRQVLLAPRPDWCACEPAPDPRDVVWKNIAVPLPQANLRKAVAGLLVLVGVVFWSSVVAFIQAWTSLSELEKIFPWLGDLDEDSILYSLLSGYLPVVALLLLLLVLPFLFQMLSYRYELVKSHSEVQRSVLERYFVYQMANIYVSVASGTIVSSLASIIRDVAKAWTILGGTLPSVAVYFLDVIIVKTLAGLPFELLRGWPLIRVMWTQRCSNRAYATEREIRTGPFGPQPMQYGWVYPTLLLVLVVCFIYAVISPFIMPAGALFFAFSYIVYKHQALYVYVPKYESGGVFWFSVYPRVLVGLGLAQLTLAGYMFIKEKYAVGVLLLPLPCFVYGYGNRSYRRYLGPAEQISLETAARIDRHDSSSATAGSMRGSRWESGRRRGVNPDEFEPLMYAQLALTSPPIEPEDCRPSDLAASLSADRSPSPRGDASSEERANALDALQAPLLGSRAAARRETSVRSLHRSSLRRDRNVVNV